MKRGFLFGLGSFLVLGVLKGLHEAIEGEYCGLTIDKECYRTASVIITLCVIALCIPLSVLAIWKANAAAPNKSWLHAIGGWLIGFCIIPVVWVPLFFAAVLIALGMGWLLSWPPFGSS